MPALVLLDPAVGLDGGWMRDIADDMFASPDYTDREEARAEKVNGSWGEVDPEELDRELDEHWSTCRAGARGWRISIPAMMSYWSELARPIPLPRNGIPMTLVRATKTDPPYVTDELLAGLAGDRPDFTLLEFDCNHMVPLARPGDTAVVIREQLSAAEMARSPTSRSRPCARSSRRSRPAGSSTYGDIADAAGLSSPRIVGWIMRTDSSDLPWHRVITASGRPAPHLATRQLELLRAEGVLGERRPGQLPRSATSSERRP